LHGDALKLPISVLEFVAIGVNIQRESVHKITPLKRSLASLSYPIVISKKVASNYLKSGCPGAILWGVYS
jgi:hypothetical protein